MPADPSFVLSPEFRAKAEAYLKALEGAAPGGGEVEGSLRRLARALLQLLHPQEQANLRRLAEGVVEAPSAELVDRARVLGDRLGEWLARAPLREETVLLVEDDPATALLTERFLESPGRRVVKAQGGEEMWRLLKDHPVDLILLDLSLPDADGRDLLVALRENPLTRHTPVVILSGRRAVEVRGEALALGADDFLEKPVEPALVRMVVGRALARQLKRSPKGGGGEPGSPGLRSLPPSGEDSQAPRQGWRARPPGPPRVLLVEDDPVAAALVRHRLARDGFVVDWLTDGEAGWDAVRRGRYDLVLTDVKVPGMDGFELLGRIRESEALRALPVILLTSLGREEEVLRGFRLGADDYILKPFSPAELTARVRRILGGG